MDVEGKFSTAAGRWEGVGPYYAMFPATFAEKVILKYSNEGDTILDPFAGRGTSIFSAGINKRKGIGIEINPVGWVYARAKLNTAPMKSVLSRLEEIIDMSPQYRSAANHLPEFFQYCYSSGVSRFLLAARENLRWRNNYTDATLMALLLVNLHGRQGSALSNQMRQTKSMSPDYAIRWWKAEEFEPPKLNIYDFLSPKIEWRYKNGTPETSGSRVYLGDSLNILPQLYEKITQKKLARPRLLFTSPPYIGITNYHYDQWLRLWLLGGNSLPQYSGNPNRGRFQNIAHYEDMMRRIFTQSAKMLSSDAVVYVRTGARPETYKVTLSILKEVFPNKELRRIARPYKKDTQTQLFGISPTGKSSEVDLILLPK